jgi:hypothetical protein
MADPDDSEILGKAIAQTLIDSIDETMQDGLNNGDPLANALVDLIEITWTSTHVIDNLFTHLIEEMTSPPDNTRLN